MTKTYAEAQLTKAQIAEAIANGAEIRGSDGVDIYLRADGWHVEHFRLTTNEETRVITDIGPFGSADHAERVELAYRMKWQSHK